MPSRSDPTSTPSNRRRRAAGVVAAVLVLVLAPMAAGFGAVVNTGRFVIGEDVVQAEDVYVAASTATIDGVVDGDLVIATGSLSIGGTVTGDVLVAARGTVSITGTIEGSLRGIARRVVVDGGVDHDVAIVAGGIDIGGGVGRDVIGFGATTTIDGRVGRDVLGRYWSLDVEGAVGRDVEVTVDRITLGEPAAVDGDVVYQAGRDVQVVQGATVDGQVIEIPAGMPFFASVVLQVALLLGFIGYLVGGIAILWLFKRTSHAAVATAAAAPLRSLGIGATAIVAIPAAVLVLAATLVGIPLAVALLFVMVLGLLFGTIPLLAAVGRRILGDRGGDFGGFLISAVLAQLIVYVWPLLGAVVFVVALVWGVGAWITAAWRVRAAAATN